MQMIEYYKQAMRNYAVFSGRAHRAEFWYFFLAYTIISVAAAILDPSGTVSALVTLIHLLPNLAIAARRLHDTGLSGWWQLLLVIPLIGVIALIVLWCREGETGSNKYGADPRLSGGAL